MRNLIFFLSAFAVLGLGFWAYQENYETRQVLREAKSLQRQIAAEREALTVLTAEWAYLNRPDRLRELAEINFGRLELLPMTADQFGRTDQLAYPFLPAMLGEFGESVEIAGQLEGVSE